MMPHPSTTSRTGAPPRAALCRVAAIVVCMTTAAALGGGPWDGAELAWRDDPRPAADVPEGFEPAPGRRTARRTRRGARRTRPVTPAGETRTGEARTGSEPAVPAAGSGAIAHRGQRYGAAVQARQRFDLHLPEGCAAGGVPLVVWIRGTDWRGGLQDDCPLLWLVSAGYAVASVDYRPSDVAQFPAQLDDCRRAIATLQRDADLWGIDPDRICVLGRAAGGHLAALVAFAPPPASGGADHDASTGDVAAVGAISAPFHLASLGTAHQRETSAASRLVGGPLAEFREAARRASPLEHVSTDAPPTLILHGARDPHVPADQSVQLDRALKAAGADSTLVMLDGDEATLDADSVPGRAIRRFLDRVIGTGRDAAPAR